MGVTQQKYRAGMIIRNKELRFKNRYDLNHYSNGNDLSKCQCVVNSLSPSAGREGLAGQPQRAGQRPLLLPLHRQRHGELQGRLPRVCVCVSVCVRERVCVCVCDCVYVCTHTKGAGCLSRVRNIAQPCDPAPLLSLQPLTSPF